MCAAVVSAQKHPGLVGLIMSSGHGFFAILMPDGTELQLRAAEFAVFDVTAEDHLVAARAAHHLLLTRGVAPHSVLMRADCPPATQTAFSSLCALLMLAVAPPRLPLAELQDLVATALLSLTLPPLASVAAEPLSVCAEGNAPLPTDSPAAAQTGFWHTQHTQPPAVGPSLLVSPDAAALHAPTSPAAAAAAALDLAAATAGDSSLMRALMLIRDRGLDALHGGLDALHGDHEFLHDPM